MSRTSHYLLKGDQGYLAALSLPPAWTKDPRRAFRWSTPQAAHRAASAWSTNLHTQISVVIHSPQYSPQP